MSNTSKICGKPHASNSSSSLLAALALVGGALIVAKIKPSKPTDPDPGPGDCIYEIDPKLSGIKERKAALEHATEVVLFHDLSEITYSKSIQAIKVEVDYEQNDSDGNRPWFEKVPYRYQQHSNTFLGVPGWAMSLYNHAQLGGRNMELDGINITNNMMNDLGWSHGSRHLGSFIPFGNTSISSPIQPGRVRLDDSTPMEGWTVDIPKTSDIAFLIGLCPFNLSDLDVPDTILHWLTDGAEIPFLPIISSAIPRSGLKINAMGAVQNLSSWTEKAVVYENNTLAALNCLREDYSHAQFLMRNGHGGKPRSVAVSNNAALAHGFPMRFILRQSAESRGWKLVRSGCGYEFVKWDDKRDEIINSVIKGVIYKYADFTTEIPAIPLSLSEHIVYINEALFIESQITNEDPSYINPLNEFTS